MKWGGAAGDTAHAAVSENREGFTCVPWADATPAFLFAQVIFKGTHVMEKHLCESATHAPMLLQCTESGQQTDETFAEALR